VCKGDFGRVGITAGGTGGRGAGAPRGAAPAPGAAAGRGGGAGGRGAAAPQITLSRNGRKFTVTGETTIRSGTEIRAETEMSPLSISLRELDSGSWVIFELPGFSSATTGTSQNSLDALRNASSTSYYRGEGSLWVKLVSSGVSGGGQGGRGVVGSIQVSK